MDEIRRHRVFAVIRADSKSRAVECARACVEGGIRLVEITFSFPGAHHVMEEISHESGVTVAAGTVLNTEMAISAFEAGVRVIVSPHTDAGLIRFTKERGLVSVAGALTSSEIVNAFNIGADIVKVFPVKYVGGPAYIKALKEPLPEIDVMVTGGVGRDNIVDYLDAGTTCIGLSTVLLGAKNDLSPDQIRDRAKNITQIVRSYKNS